MGARNASSERTISTEANASENTISDWNTASNPSWVEETSAARTNGTESPGRVLDHEVAVGQIAARHPLAVDPVDGRVRDPGSAFEADDHEARQRRRGRGEHHEVPDPHRHGSPASGAAARSGGSRRGSSSASSANGRNQGM